ncbi:MAG: hypothetical protein LRZ85_03945 [Alphaproteobacteria bacterium]|nr:hypothetical protein [Alphaproteobacteria bacterium]
MADNYAQALVEMGRQLTSVMIQQMQIVGSFFDADEQLDTQRDIQLFTLRAHKDYHPSEQLCAYGSGIRSIANTEERGRMNQRAFNAVLIEQYSGKENTSTQDGMNQDMQSRLDKFKNTYCNPMDNNGTLWEMCFKKGEDYTAIKFEPEQLERFNKDIDYHLTFTEPLTLNVDLTNAGPGIGPDDAYNKAELKTEEDLIALARNLYWSRAMDVSSLKNFDEQAYLKSRSIMARTALAHNSFASIMAIKSKAPPKTDPAEEIKTGGAHLKAVLRDFFPPGSDAEAQIEERYGKNPSYFAQMEILSKTIYQHPKFYTNLYDKPANVDRINAAMSAIRLMQLRDRFDSQTRREMLMAALMEDSLFPEESRVYSMIQKINAGRQ